MRGFCSFVVLVTLAACGATPGLGPADAATDLADAGLDAGPDLEDAGAADAGLKSDTCAAEFGTGFTAAFGRVDGRVTAVVPPGVHCPFENDDHLVIQVALGDAGIHRLVVNVRSTSADPNVYFLAAKLGALPAPDYAEGWHPGLTLDYANTLGVHSDADAGWESLDMAHASARVYDALEVGAPLSVYASSSGPPYASSVHLVHRHAHNDDGAIVVNPRSASPTWLLFHFAEQTF